MAEKSVILKMRESTGMNRKDFAEYFGIPYRTVQDWETGKRGDPAGYLIELMLYKLTHADPEKRGLTVRESKMGSRRDADPDFVLGLQKHLWKTELEYRAKQPNGSCVDWLAPYCDTAENIARFLRYIGFQVSEIVDEEPWPGEEHRWVVTTSGVIVYVNSKNGIEGLVAGSAEKRNKR